MEPEKEVKELDLFDLLKMLVAWIGGIFKSLFNGILWIIRFSFKNWYFIGTFLVIGIALAFYLSQPKFSRYDGIIVLENNVGNSTEFHTALLSLSSLMNKEDENGLFSQTMGITTEVGKKVMRLKPLYIYTNEDEGLFNLIDEKQKYQDLEPHQKKFAVLVRTRDRALFPIIRNAMINYFENHPHFKATNASRLEFLRVQQQTLEKEISILDSLKNLEYFEANSRAKNLKMDNALLIGESKTQLYHTNIIEMRERLELSKIDKQVRGNVLTLSSDFIIKPPHNERVKFLVFFGISFFVIGFIFSLIVRFRKEIKSFVQKD